MQPLMPHCPGLTCCPCCWSGNKEAVRLPRGNWLQQTLCCCDLIRPTLYCSDLGGQLSAAAQDKAGLQHKTRALCVLT